MLFRWKAKYWDFFYKISSKFAVFIPCYDMYSSDYNIHQCLHAIYEEPTYRPKKARSVTLGRSFSITGVFRWVLSLFFRIERRKTTHFMLAKVKKLEKSIHFKQETSKWKVLYTYSSIWLSQFDCIVNLKTIFGDCIFLFVKIQREKLDILCVLRLKKIRKVHLY